MKSRLKWLVLVLCLVMGFSVLAIACGDDNKTTLTVGVTEVTLYKGQTYELAEDVTVSPEDTEVEYATANTLIANVGKRSGRIEAMNKGTVVITVKAGGNEAKVTVNVMEFDEPFVIAGQIVRSDTVFLDSLWGDKTVTDGLEAGDDFENGKANKLGDILGKRWFKKTDTAGVYSTTLDLYVGSEFKIRQLGQGWSGQLNYTSNAAWATVDNDGYGILDEEEVYKDGKKKSEYVDARDDDASHERGFRILINGNYTFTVDTRDVPTVVDFEYNNSIAPAPQPKDFTVTIEKEGAEEPLYTKANKENADLSYSTFVDLAVGDVITIKYEGDGEKTDGAVNEVVKGIEGLPAGLTQAADGKITCTTANMYNISVKLTTECKVDSAVIAVGAPVEINAWGNWVESWSDGDIEHVKGNIPGKGEEVELSMTVTFTETREFGFQIRFEGASSSEWAAGGALAEGVELPAGLTQAGNFTAAAGTYTFTFKITLTEAGALTVSITNIVKA